MLLRLGFPELFHDLFGFDRGLSRLNVLVVEILQRDLSGHGGAVVSPQPGHGWLGVACAWHLGLPPKPKCDALTISFLSLGDNVVELEMPTAGSGSPMSSLLLCPPPV